MKLNLSGGTLAVIEKLNRAGFLAYAIGGCVRDLAMGNTPCDFDVATNARPEQVQRLFEKTVDTGSTFGTITVILLGEAIEVTTFRKECCYQDGRHPGQVEFVGELEQDVLRRDFTINALAYHPEQGLIDLVGGLADIQAKTIRAIGDPDRRFAEDGLRILRAVRLTCVLDFEIEEQTKQSMQRNMVLLRNASVERIWQETKKTFVCQNGKRLGEFTDILEIIFPEIAPMVGFEQHHPYHHLGVWQHTLLAFATTQPDLLLRTTVFFHDSGKPLTCSSGEDGKTHFYGHPEQGASLAWEALTRVRCEKNIREQVALLIRHHDIDIGEDDVCIKRCLRQFGRETFAQLLAVKRADNSAKHPDKVPELMRWLDAIQSKVHTILERGDCYSLEQMAIQGEDLLHLGMEQGETIGRVLGELLEDVIQGSLPNERAALLSKAKEKMDGAQPS